MELLEDKLGMGDVEALQATVDHLTSEEVWPCGVGIWTPRANLARARPLLCVYMPF